MKNIALLLFLLTSCNLMPFDHPIIDSYNGYEIKKGNNHASNRIFIPKDGNVLNFDAIFFPSAMYDAKDSAIHKLYGFTDVNSIVHKNSARIGWRCNNRGTIDIFAYYYVSGKLGYKYLGETLPDVENKYRIVASGNHYEFTMNERTIRVKRSKDSEKGVRTRLYPYFEDGKGKGAPHDMTFYIYEN